MTATEEKTEFKFSELSDKAKETARQTHTGDNYLDYTWYEYVFEDAVRMAAILGITISTTWHKNSHGKDYQTTDIYFSGFCSQGNGASFEGSYEPVSEASAKIREETNDAVLHELADRLGMLQLTRKLQGLDPFTAKISRGYGSGNYSHSGTMVVNPEFDDDDSESLGDVDALDKEISQAMRDFADWIYRQLNDEHDWLHSDECVDECLTEEIFDEDGVQL